MTVGSEEKRTFLTENFGIPPDRIFSSRTTRFASEIMKATAGRGIDVIVNSLTGELLDESWRICADGGSMVEIGKKDIVDRNYLSMEPFDRNCSFRPVDFSHEQITDVMISAYVLIFLIFPTRSATNLVTRLLSQIFSLLKAGHIKPITPMKIFPVTEYVSSEP